MTAIVGKTGFESHYSSFCLNAPNLNLFKELKLKDGNMKFLSQKYGSTFFMECEVLYKMYLYMIYIHIVYVLPCNLTQIHAINL